MEFAHTAIFFFFPDLLPHTHLFLAAFKDSALANSSKTFTVVDLGAAYGQLVGVGRNQREITKTSLRSRGRVGEGSNALEEKGRTEAF